MPTTAPTPCHQCGTLGPCPHRGQARRIRRSTRWTNEAKATITAWVQEHGWWCPGWQTPGHPTPPGTLTVDHVDSLAAHGETGRHNVLCRPCNARKGANS